MSAVTKGRTQKEMFLQLLRLLIDRSESMELDYFTVGEAKQKGWEAVEIVFRPKSKGGGN